VQCDHRRFPEQWQVLSPPWHLKLREILRSDFMFLRTTAETVVELTTIIR
jgi:hypothetical protein